MQSNNQNLENQLNLNRQQIVENVGEEQKEVKENLNLKLEEEFKKETKEKEKAKEQEKTKEKENLNKIIFSEEIKNEEKKEDEEIKTKEKEKENLNEIIFGEAISEEIRNERRKIYEETHKEILNGYIKPFEKMREEFFGLSLYNVWIMEYCYNYLSKYVEGYEINIDEKIKEEDFKKLKEMFYESREVFGYVEEMNEIFKKIKADDEYGYFKMAILLNHYRLSANKINQMVVEMRSFVEKKVKENTLNDCEYLVKKKGIIPKIVNFKNEFGAEFHSKIFNIYKEDLHKKALEEGRKKARDVFNSNFSNCN